MTTLFSRLLALSCLFLAFNAPAIERYVSVNNLNPTFPYATWATAATNIQDAIDASTFGDEVVVTNGVYNTGFWTNGASTYRVGVTNYGMKIRSVNGPAVTVIEGSYTVSATNVTGVGGVRLGAGDMLLSGFTVRNASGGISSCCPDNIVSNCVVVDNVVWYAGGGIQNASVYNSIISGNQAVGGGDWGIGGGTLDCHLNNCIVSSNYAAYGGGCDSSTLNNCLIVGNIAMAVGGASSCSLNNSTVVGNSASNFAGGVQSGTLKNCIVYGNTAPTQPNFSTSSPISLNYCCTTPLPASGTGNFTNNPLFVNEVGGNFRLQVASPCVNSGNNASAPVGPDLDGNPRIAFGTVDLGAYELQPLVAPTLTSQQQTTNLVIGWDGISGVTYQAFYSTNLVDWLPYGAAFPGSNTTVELFVPIDLEFGKFFRVRASN